MYLNVNKLLNGFFFTVGGYRLDKGRQQIDFTAGARQGLYGAILSQILKYIDTGTNLGNFAASRRTVSMPSRASAVAAYEPPGPPPITRTVQLFCMDMMLVGGGKYTSVDECGSVAARC